jgi:hypothetical protein
MYRLTVTIGSRISLILVVPASRRVVHLDDGAVAHFHFIHHGRRGGDQVHVEFALQTLLHDFHVQQAQEAAAEAEAQRLRHFRLVHQRGVVELQLFQRVAQRVVLVGFDREQAGKHLRLHFLEARQRRRRRRLASVMVSPTLAAFSSLMPAMMKPTWPADSCGSETSAARTRRCLPPAAPSRWPSA